MTNSLVTVPIRPETRKTLKRVSLIKGARATTAIEGNTLTEEEIEKILEGRHLPASKAYQEKEVDNILRAMNQITRDLFDQQTPAVITPDLLRQYHHLVGHGLSAPFNAIPGEFAQSQRTVGTYRCPPPGRGKHQVEGLVKSLCDWLKKEFGFASGKQTFRDAIVQAIVTHVYIEWIHPFDDGNGRTGRLVEFYLLLRAGVPDICAHLLSNHYNATRPEYYAHIQKCQKERQLTSFIDYAVAGFLDGLNDVWENVSREWLERAWRGYVYDQFADIKWSKPVFRRRRKLLLDLPPFEQHDIDSIQSVSPVVIRYYGAVNVATVKRDIRELLDKGLLTRHPETGKISANIEVLRSQYPPTLRK